MEESDQEHLNLHTSTNSHTCIHHKHTCIQKFKLQIDNEFKMMCLQRRCGNSQKVHEKMFTHHWLLSKYKLKSQ